jgi:predicted protein tyrosine phosphatase
VIDVSWVNVGAGRLALWHRPGRKSLPAIRDAGATHLVTLLAEREGGREVGAAATAAGLTSIWMPMDGAEVPVGEARVALEAGLDELSRLLDGGASLLIHCSAGIHRTGMVAYALLRLRGLSGDEALEAIGRSREHTRAGFEPWRARWGDELAEARQGRAGTRSADAPAAG